jgi:hypothetical protein
MTFLDEVHIQKLSVKFWSGFDLEQILKHPKDGYGGFMIVLVESIESERLKFQRENIINRIIGDNNLIDFDNLLDNVNNSFLAIYQSIGDDQLLVKILKEKFTKTLDWRPIRGIA